MPGSGHHGGDHPLDKIKNEMQSALKLVFKDIGHGGVSLALEPALTVFRTEMDAECHAVTLESPVPEVSDDPIRILADRETSVASLELLEEARLAPDAPCVMEPVMSHEPVLDRRAFQTVGVSFGNLAAKVGADWPTEAPRTDARELSVEKDWRPAPGSVVTRPFSAKVGQLAGAIGRIKTQDASRFYAMPIRKSPIPPHRFSVAIRDRFRTVLAEKAGAKPANVQLRIIYERMDMSLFVSIQQDEQGNLLCTPRNELLGRNLENLAGQTLLKRQADSSAYLVYGFRLDTKEELRALVPANMLSDLHPNGEEDLP